MSNDRKPDGYWNIEENVAIEARRAMREQEWENLPSQEVLERKGYSGLTNAIRKHYGSVRECRKMLGQSNPTKPNGFWEDQDNALAEARKAMEEQGWDRLPSQKELSDRGYSPLVNAIGRYHGGLVEFREILGQAPSRRRAGLLENESYMLSEVRAAMQEQDWEVLPSQEVLAEHGYSSLGNAINKYHGGIRGVRKMLGQSNPTKPNGFWEDQDNALAEAGKAMEEQGWTTLPSGDVLEGHGYSALSNGISKHHGGFLRFRTLMGQENSRVPRGYWKSLENTLAEARSTLEENSWENLPSQGRLSGAGKSDLLHAINRYHGGLLEFRRILEERGISPSPQQDLEKLLGGYGDE
jgi:hypothetical protein